MLKKVIILAFVILLGILFFKTKPYPVSPNIQEKSFSHPLSIEEMRGKNYPGSDLVIEQTLEDGSNYHQYVASYRSEELKIYGLLTVPIGENPPAGGWPVIAFNHGYIPPDQYRTTEKYVDYVDAFARNGYIVFKSDYRGHGESEGRSEGAYYSPAYAIDVLNALSSLKKFPEANPNKIGMWGHSLGGNITLRSLLLSKDIKAAVIWAGVVGSYQDLLNRWRGRSQDLTPQARMHVSEIRRAFIKEYGTPESNPSFWDSIDPTKHLADLTAPVQLHHGTSDETVPLLFSQNLADGLKQAQKEVELYTYEEDNHNISQSFNLAMQRSIDFFDKYLK